MQPPGVYGAFRNFMAAPGWAKVRHRDGVTGFVRATQVWGL